MSRKPNIEVTSFDEPGYQPLVDFGSWRVAMLNDIDELAPDKIDNFQCHLQTDEVFVLLQGRCILFLAEVGEGAKNGGSVGSSDKSGQILKIEAIDMVPNKLYNIKQGVYHTHTLSEDGKVLIVENRDTGDHNSPKIAVDADIQGELSRLTAELWQVV